MADPANPPLVAQKPKRVVNPVQGPGGGNRVYLQPPTAKHALAPAESEQQDDNR